jgi:LCP family protein required for cell wall assembly
LADELPPEQENGGEYYEYQRRGVNTMLIVAIGVFAVMSFYLSLIIATRVDAVIFPGNEISLAIGGVSVPGTGGPPPTEAETIGQRINILVLGLDQRLDQPDDQAYRTDSVVIFSIDPFSKTAGALSIPRDTRVEIPDKDGGVYMSTRINEAYEMGEFGVNGYPSGYDGGGPGLAMDTIEHNFDIPIDYYVILNWQNFIKIIDELGGIDIDVPEAVYDPLYSEYQYGDYHAVSFEPGLQHMDGHTALEYARLRKSDNDYKRIERQQLVMRAVAARATSLNYTDVGKAKDLYGAYKDSIQTNVPDLQIPGLARLGGQIGLENVKLVSAGPATYPCPASICGPAAELLWDPTKFAELKDQVFSNHPVAVENAKITVLNGTNTSRLASTFRSQLALNGIPSIDVKTDEQANGLIWDTTLIIDVTGHAPNTVQQIKTMLFLDDSRVVTPAIIQSSYPDLVPFLATTDDIIVALGGDAQVSAPDYPADVPDSSQPDVTTPEPTEPEQPDFTTPTEEPTEAPIEFETPAPTDEPLPTDTPVETETGG